MNFLSSLVGNSSRDKSTKSNVQGVISVEPSDKELNPQRACAFFTILPAEIRNEIYQYIFETSSPPPLTKEQLDKRPQMCQNEESVLAHPLSFLLTCRDSYFEAKMIAFRTHTFSMKANLPFYILKARIKRLDATLVSAITSVTQTVNRSGGYYPGFMQHGISAICSLIVLLPSLSYVEFKTYRKGIFDPEMSSPEGKVTSCAEHVPQWFLDGGQWQGNLSNYQRHGIGEWRTEWPNYHVHESARDDYREALGGQFCDGKCTALLVNSERTVTVALVNLWANDAPLVFLNPNEKQRLSVEQSSTDDGLDGIMYDPGEEYWTKLKPWSLEQPDKGPFGLKVSLGEAASTVWKASLPHFLLDMCKGKEVTVLKVPEHLKDGVRSRSPDLYMEGFGFDGRDEK